ncbi:hypothetical protein JTB14_022412 [Gonioctena quinquepunctata]|nr:hypothetical protein JTB14_022412 [Gonioctena quinquepunctata]
MIINQKKKYYSSKIEQSVNKPRVIWQIIKQPLSKESSQDTRFSSNELNDYFVIISSNILKQLENTPVDPAKLTSSYIQFHKSIFFMPVDSTEVGHIIANLSDSTALDVYGLTKLYLFIVPEVCLALNDVLKDLVKMPKTSDDWLLKTR